MATNAKAFNSGTAMAQDWPNLGKYQKANAQLALAATTETRVVFLGDSITESPSSTGC